MRNLLKSNDSWRTLFARAMLNKLHNLEKYVRVRIYETFMSLLLLGEQYIPHGHCYLWQTPLVGLHVAADALIALAYYSIPIILIYFVREIEELPFKNIFVLFGAFILFCGTTHLVEIWVLWHPNYWIYGILKAITALISIYTAVSLVPIIPVVLKLPSPQKLQDLNQQLIAEISAKETAKQEIYQLNQELEQKVKAKTSALIESVKFKEKITDRTPNLIYIFDLKTQRNVYCNPFITELLGYTPSQLQKFKDGIIEELIHPEDIELLKQHFQNCLSLKTDDCLEIEYRIKNTHGQWYWLHDKNTIFARNSNGEPEQILGIARDVTETRELNQQLEEKVVVLETRDKARIKLAQMNEFIQACISLDEAQEVIVDLLQPLFPNTAGAVYLTNNSKNIVDAIATWKNPHTNLHFEPKECWGIRRGNTHIAYPHTPGLYCSHLNLDTEGSPSLCLPMIARGETIGLLHLQFNNTISHSTQNIAETVAQNLALSFANLKLQEELRYQSLRDPLTGLYNRRYLEETLNKEIDRAHRQQQFISVIMLDVDHFKRFNDVHGHSVGDLVLSKIGAYLLLETRKYDIACRYGGEELIIVMPNASIENSIMRAEKIRSDIKNFKLEHEGKELKPITVSIGVSCFPDDSINTKGLIDAADKALYQAKEEGRDRVKRC